MKEYLICREDKDFCLIHASKFLRVLHPNSIESSKIQGWGDYRIKVEDCEISFSFEEAGIQISFEMCEVSNELANRIVNEICRNVENEIKQSCYKIQISD